jgi:hypothetical protein
VGEGVSIDVGEFLLILLHVLVFPFPSRVISIMLVSVDIERRLYLNL